MRLERSIIGLFITYAIFVAALQIPAIPLDFYLAENKYSVLMQKFCRFAQRNSLRYFYDHDEFGKDVDVTLKGKLLTKLNNRDQEPVDLDSLDEKALEEKQKRDEFLLREREAANHHRLDREDLLICLNEALTRLGEGKNPDSQVEKGKKDEDLGEE